MIKRFFTDVETKVFVVGDGDDLMGLTEANTEGDGQDDISTINSSSF